MESKCFNNLDDEKLIKMVRYYPVLYKLYDENYKNNIRKENVWNNISAAVGKTVNQIKIIIILNIVILFLTKIYNINYNTK